MNSSLDPHKGFRFREIYTPLNENPPTKGPHYEVSHEVHRVPRLPPILHHDSDDADGSDDRADRKLGLIATYRPKFQKPAPQGVWFSSAHFTPLLMRTPTTLGPDMTESEISKKLVKHLAIFMMLKLTIFLAIRRLANSLNK